MLLHLRHLAVPVLLSIMNHCAFLSKAALSLYVSIDTLIILIIVFRVHFGGFILSFFQKVINHVLIHERTSIFALDHLPFIPNSCNHAVHAIIRLRKHLLQKKLRQPKCVPAPPPPYILSTQDMPPKHTMVGTTTTMCGIPNTSPVFTSIVPFSLWRALSSIH